MKFAANKLARRLPGVALGVLLLSVMLCMEFAWAQEAPRPEGSSPIKPPMIKPPMNRSQNTNSGSVSTSRRRRRVVRRKRSARRKVTTKREIVAAPVTEEKPGEPFPVGSGPPAIKPPMANESNTPLTASPRIRKPISGGVLNGKAVSLPRPVYPAIARSARASGLVVVQIIIDEEGRVISARAVSGHPLLQQAAVNAARQARFAPTRIWDQRVKVTGTLSYNFVQ